MDLLQTIGSGATAMIQWTGEVVEAVFTTGGSLNVLAPLALLSVAGTIIFLGVKIIKSLVYGA